MRYAIGAIAIVIIAFLAIFAVVNNNPGSSTTTVVTPGATKLASLANTGVEVSFTYRGKITGDDTFRSVRIRINSSERVVEILNGYNQSVDKSQSFPNNQTAFNEFLYALDNAGYTRKQTPLYSDSRGVCPTGNLFHYDYVTADSKNHDLWATTCSSKEGSFAGAGSLTRQLFQAQITGYSKFITGTQL